MYVRLYVVDMHRMCISFWSIWWLPFIHWWFSPALNCNLAGSGNMGGSAVNFFARFAQSLHFQFPLLYLLLVLQVFVPVISLCNPVLLSKLDKE